MSGPPPTSVNSVVFCLPYWQALNQLTSLIEKTEQIPNNCMLFSKHSYFNLQFKQNVNELDCMPKVKIVIFKRIATALSFVVTQRAVTQKAEATLS